MKHHSQRYKDYIRSDRFKFLSWETWKRAGEKCQRCKQQLLWYPFAHHLCYDRLGEEWPSDLECLCDPCHNKANAEREFAIAMRETLHKERAFLTWSKKKYGFADRIMRVEFDNWWDRRTGGQAA